MKVFKRWELWVTFAIFVLGGVMQYPVLCAPGGKVSAVLSLLIPALGMFSSIFGNKLTRGANPHERSTDVVPK